MMHKSVMGRGADRTSGEGYTIVLKPPSQEQYLEALNQLWGHGRRTIQTGDEQAYAMLLNLVLSVVPRQQE